MAATTVLVHGGWSGPWIWRDVCAVLDEHGVPNVAVDLPSCSAPDAAAGFKADADHVRNVVDEIGGPVILAGNSYGGVVITEAAVANASVQRLVYLAAFMPGAGDNLDEFMGDATVPTFASLIKFRDDGLVQIDVEGALMHAFGQAPPAATELVRANLDIPMSFGPDMASAVSGSPWKTTPSTYVVCTEDGAIKPEAQREWAKQRATDFVEWPSDHCPQCSHPKDVADLLERLAHEA